jgi:hypothetical protein
MDASEMVMAGLKWAPLTAPDTTTITVMAKPKAMLSSNSPYAPVVIAVATVIRPIEASRNTAPNSANARFHRARFSISAPPGLPDPDRLSAASAPA